jgi:hypothetical protein
VLKFVADILALFSAAAFSIPAWYGNRSGHLLVKMNLKSLRLGEPEFQTQYDGLVKELQEQRDGWKPWKAWSFYIGTAAGLLAAALVVWTSLHEQAPPSVHT